MKKVTLAILVTIAISSGSVYAGGAGGQRPPPAQFTELSIMDQIRVFFGFEL